MIKTPELLGVCLTVVAVFATFGATRTFAASTPPSMAAAPAAEARYRQERADCLAGRTAQSRETCLKEAGASAQAARAHDLSSNSAQQLAANERKRCDPLAGDERQACLARADGLGTTSGSVAAGGQLHELATAQPAVAPQETPASH